MPDAENPAPPETDTGTSPQAASELTTEQYHERADAYLADLLDKLEQLAEEKPDLEVDYAVSFGSAA